MNDELSSVDSLSSDKKRALLEKLLKEKIESANSWFPLSYGQQALWFLYKLKPESAIYNLAVGSRISGPLNQATFEQAFSDVVKRHSALRTRFTEQDGELVQQPDNKHQVNLEFIDASSWAEQQMEQYFRQQSSASFDLEHGLLYRARVLCRAENEYVFAMFVHHIAFDGVSSMVMVDDFVAFYAGQKAAAQAATKTEYRDFVQWQRSLVNDNAGAVQFDYWEQQLTGEPVVLNLPVDQTYDGSVGEQGGSIKFTLEKAQVQLLRTLGQQSGTRPYTVLLAAFQVLLHRYTGQHEIRVGVPAIGRTKAEFENVVGYFVNPLAFRGLFTNDPSFRDFLDQVRDTVVDGLANQDYPFSLIVERLHPQRVAKQNPFFQVMMDWQTIRGFSEDDITPLTGYAGDRRSKSGLRFEPVMFPQQEGLFDLFLDIKEIGASLYGQFKYDSALFEAATVERLVSNFQTLLGGIVANPDCPVSRLPLLSELEQQQLLLEWNSTDADYLLEGTLHELIEAQVQDFPDRVAIVFEGEQLTYAALNARANQLGHYLRSQGVGPDVLVAICVDRSIEMVVGLLGILKAGGAYVPLDPAYPKERLAFMLEDAQVPLLLTQEHLVQQLPDSNAQRVCLDSEWGIIAKESEDNPDGGANPENLAYVIYTSGSTGKPKGVMNTHRGICNRLIWMQEEYQLDESDRVLQKTTFSFDVSVWEFFWPLLTGSCLVVAKPEGHRDSAYLIDVITKEQITTIHFVPSMLRAFLQEREVENCSCLKRVICSGEALPVELQEKFFSHIEGTELHNLYGPTEAAIDVTYWQCEPDSKRLTVPIGRPIANIQTYILDKYQQPVPIGVPGELHIAGIGLARGYLNRPELTAERFIPNPFSNEQGARLYKTGDLARYLATGDIEYLGRLDFQVKIRGLRIELGEIESALMEYPDVSEAVVIVREDNEGDQRLVAYVVSINNDPSKKLQLRELLRQRLPDYMVPANIIFLEAIPHTPNGKIDRKALPAPSPDLVREQVQEEFIAPQTELEMALADIWKEVLKVETIGIRDNFFDLGGHSLQIVEIFLRLKQRFEIEMSVVDLFQYNTIEALAEYLEQPAGKPTQGEEHGELAAGMGAEPKVEELQQYRAMDGRVYTYRRYCETDRASALASFAKSFSQNDADVLDVAFEWKYLESNSMPGDGSTLGVLDCDGDIVGMNGGVSARFKIEDNTIPGCWGSDFQVTPDHRVVAGWVWSEITRHSSGLKLSVPGVDLYPILSESESVIDIDQYVILVACLDLGAVLKTRGWPSTFSSICGFLFRPLPAIFDRYTRARAATGIDVIEISRFDERFDQFWQVVSSDYPAIMVRDQAFLSWRFDRCPIRDYTRYAAVREGEIVGYIVTRSYASGEKERGMIVDYLVRRNDSAVLSALIQTAMQDFRSRGAVSVKCSLSSSQREHIRQLRSHGFLIQRPGLHIVADRGFYDKSLAAIGEWFITYADGDFDYCSWEGDEERVLGSDG
jgi:amino acid adenylation domain-containing protein